MKHGKIILGLTLVVAAAFALSTGIAIADNAAGKDAVLGAKDIGEKLFPEMVFYRGQLAPTQLRNTGGVRFADGFYTIAGLCDNSGYSSDVRQKFQGYLLTEVPLVIGGQSLKAGAYGFGFVEGGQLLLTDIGAHDLFQTASARDTEMKRPVPLQVVAGEKGAYRLYSGRDYVEWQAAK